MPQVGGVHVAGGQLTEAPSEPLSLEVEPPSPVTAPKPQLGLPQPSAQQAQLGLSQAHSLSLLPRPSTGKAFLTLDLRYPICQS